MDYRKKVLNHFNAKVIIDFGDQILDTYEEIETADGYEIFVHMPSGKWSNVFPESDIYYYVDDMIDPIREHIESGGEFYVSESIAESLDLTDCDSDFWENMCYEHNLIDEDDD
jgi:hypothetical protein